MSDDYQPRKNSSTTMIVIVVLAIILAAAAFFYLRDDAPAESKTVVAPVAVAPITEPTVSAEVTPKPVYEPPQPVVEVEPLPTLPVNPDSLPKTKAPATVTATVISTATENCD